MAKLTTKQRDKLKDSDFAVPGKRKLPIHDASHVKAAWDFLPRTKDLSDAEIKEARKRILAKAKEFGVDTADWEKKKVSKEGFVELSLESMTPVQRRIRSLIMDTDDATIGGLSVSDEGFMDWVKEHPFTSATAILFAGFPLIPVAAYIWEHGKLKMQVIKWAQEHLSKKEADEAATDKRAFKIVLEKYRKYYEDKKKEAKKK